MGAIHLAVAVHVDLVEGVMPAVRSAARPGPPAADLAVHAQVGLPLDALVY